MLLREWMGPMIIRNVRIFPTDIDPDIVCSPTIREGLYPETELQRIPLDILSNDCTANPDYPGFYCLSDEIRRLVEFSRHDLLKLYSDTDGPGHYRM